MKLLPAFALASSVSAGAGVIMLVGDNFDRVVMHRDRRGYWDFPFGKDESYDRSRKVNFIRRSEFSGRKHVKHVMKSFFRMRPFVKRTKSLGWTKELYCRNWILCMNELQKAVFTFLAIEETLSETLE